MSLDRAHLPKCTSLHSSSWASHTCKWQACPCPGPEHFPSVFLKDSSLLTSCIHSNLHSFPPPWPFWGRRKMAPWARWLVLSNGAELKLCPHPDTPRTKLVTEAEFCWSKEIRWPCLRSGKLPCLHMHRKAPWGSKREEAPPHNKCGCTPTGLWSGIHLSKTLPTHLAKCPRTSLVWKKKQDNWPKVLQHARPWRSDG